MSNAHRHDHGLTRQKLPMAFVLTGLILVVELVGAYLSHSLALLSDAGHVFTDLFAVGMAWYAAARATKPPDARNTFGYHRAGILTAFVSALMLIGIVVWVGIEAVSRFRHPQTVTPSVMFIAASVGIAVNLFIALGLTGNDRQSLNIRAVVLHAIGDIGASFGVIIGGIVIVLTGWQYADLLVSIGIAILIAINAVKLWLQTVDILMEATPKGLNIHSLVDEMIQIGNLRGVHDLHVWTIAGGRRMLSAHIQVADEQALRDSDVLIKRLRDKLRTQFRISHTTLQVELAVCQDGCADRDKSDVYCIDDEGAHELSESGSIPR
jgi:cobalt-zinc-cadmium efflux system protein